jgi:predicted transcriptional regulator
MTPVECQARRAALGLSPYELARRAGLVERTILRFEAGLSAPRPVTLVALRRAFRSVESNSSPAAQGTIG